MFHCGASAAAAPVGTIRMRAGKREGEPGVIAKDKPHFGNVGKRIVWGLLHVSP